MKALKIIGLTLISFITCGQIPKLTDEQYNSSGMIRLELNKSLTKADSLAEYDISRGIPFLILQSGISPKVFSSDKIFEEKYKVYYHDLGCTGSMDKYAAAYNRRTFEYLKEKYGRKWTREIRKDVIGFRKWRWLGR